MYMYISRSKLTIFRLGFYRSLCISKIIHSIAMKLIWRVKQKNLFTLLIITCLSRCEITPQ